MRKTVLWLLTLLLPMCVHADGSGYGLTTKATYEVMRERGEEVLFVDVRDPIEIMFVGATDVVDINIPFLIADRYDWDEENNRFRMERNPRFVDEIQKALKAKGLDENATIITMCRSGSERGEPSALFLRNEGFENARFVIHGFQGDAKGEGEMAGRRVVNGWQNDGLPWSSGLSGTKIYRSERKD